MKIVIFGGTGWLGQNLISNLYDRGIDCNDIIVISSIKKKIKFKNYNLVTLNLSEFLSLEKLWCDEYYDFAFLSKYSLSKISNNQFIDMTNLLINASTNFINKNYIQKALLASSGAVYSNKSELEPYSLQKLNQEKQFKRSCLSNDTSFHIARIFSLLAPYIDVDANYALSNFIKFGIKKETIKINSNKQVIRSYLAPETLFTYFIRNNKTLIYDAWNLNLDIYELASLISKIFDVALDIPNNYHISKYKDIYTSKNDIFQKVNLVEFKKEIIENIIDISIAKEFKISKF